MDAADDGDRRLVAYALAALANVPKAIGRPRLDQPIRQGDHGARVAREAGDARVGEDPVGDRAFAKRRKC